MTRRLELKTLLIGDNSFIGVSHLSQDRARARTEQLNTTRMASIVERAAECGASGFTFSTHPTNLEILRALHDSDKISVPFDLYPVLPYAQGYVRLANEKGMRGLFEEVLSRMPLSDKAAAIFKGGLSALKLDFTGLMQAYIDMELGTYLKVKPRTANLRSVLLHEVATDLCLGLGSVNLLEAFANHVREGHHVRPGFITYNLSRFVELLRDSELNMEDIDIMTPFNSIGYQMSPSRSACEACLSPLPKSNVIAMSIMAGGYLNLDQAYEYLNTLPKLSGIAVGVSSEEHATQTFEKLRKLLSPM